VEFEYHFDEKLVIPDDEIEVEEHIQENVIKNKKKTTKGKLLFNDIHRNWCRHRCGRAFAVGIFCVPFLVNLFLST